jgi:hypothetical protein
MIALNPWDTQISITQDTGDATSSDSDPWQFPVQCHETWRERSVWFRFVPPYPGRLTINTTGTSFDHQLSARVDACFHGIYVDACFSNPVNGAEFAVKEPVSFLVGASPQAAGSTLQVRFTYEPDPSDRVVIGFGGEGAHSGDAWYRVRGHAPPLGSVALHQIGTGPQGPRGVRPAVGDLDGDGIAETVLGFSRDSTLIIPDWLVAGWRRYLPVHWPAYAAVNGETYPAVGNLDDDPEAEIVVGLGTDAAGFFFVFDDETTDFAPFGGQRGWYRVPWPQYNAGADGSVRPAIGDVDGDGKNEIILGLGPGSGGYLAILDAAQSGLSLRTWIRVGWPSYNAANGETFPAAGDLDGDGSAELVIGLGAGGQGFAELKEDALEGFGNGGWYRTRWPAYEAAVGETHPAIGNIDGDARAELVVGLGAYPAAGGPWWHVVDDAATGYAHIKWVQERQLGTDPDMSGKAIFPAAGVLK